jgi:hypothetical protein
MFANVTVARPELAKVDSHSLAELAAESADARNIVEVGWTVDRSLFKDVTHPNLYNARIITSTTMRFGGPGSGTC